jgi:hypothetical protein
MIVSILRSSRRHVVGLWFEMLTRIGRVESQGPPRLVVPPTLTDAASQRLAKRLKEALDLILIYDPVKSRGVQRNVRTIAIFDNVSARVIPTRRMILLERRAVENLSIDRLAGQLIFLATYARMLARVYESEHIRKRMECRSRKAELSFIERIPGTIDLRLELQAEASDEGCI